MREPGTGDPSDPVAAVEPVAVIGVGCRFPGADSPDAYWDLLARGDDAIREAPPDRWDADELYSSFAGVPGKMNSRWGGFLDRIDAFDAGFFRISPREAASMDPQHRLLLEVAWEALENAGISPETIAGTACAAMIGIASNDYTRLVMKDLDQINAYALTGNASSLAVNRLSYFLDLCGPSIAVDSACSSSLTAVHLALQSLRHRETDVALAGAVSLMVTPHNSVAAAQLWLMAPGGRCRSYDANADGYVRGEGCGVLVLKRLADAIRDGDPVLAVLRGSAVNHNGRERGMTAPSVPALVALIRQALATSGASPDCIGYVEGHGMASRSSDDVELKALIEVFGPRASDQPLYLGSVKTNIGSLEPAGGIAGLIKVILAIHHGEIPRHLHFETPNPLLSAMEGIRIPRNHLQWPAQNTPRRAGVNAFGIGGTNAHVIVEEAPAYVQTRVVSNRPLHLLTLSARSETALKELAARYRAFLAARPGLLLEDLCCTAATGRSHFACRAALTAESLEDLVDALDQFDAGQSSPFQISGVVPPEGPARVVFVLPDCIGWDDAAVRWISDSEPVFRKTVEQALAPGLSSVHDQDHKTNRIAAASSGMSEVSPAAPGLQQYTRIGLSCSTLQSAMSALWQSWGVEPASIIGRTQLGICSNSGTGTFQDALEEYLRSPLDDPHIHGDRALSIAGAGTSNDLAAPPVTRTIFLVMGALDEAAANKLLPFGEVLETAPFPDRPDANPSGAWRSILESLAVLYVRGAPINWHSVYKHHAGRRIALPTYPFQRQRHWVDD